ncbi:MAG: type I 3-dehydroquinate dehydratase [Ignavibacteria bacterium]|nr:type I 3-dehydroquinate dehydratase [Ignavibacteria bacterium]
MSSHTIKYCISISNTNSVSEIVKFIPKGSFIEYRLDTAFSLDDIKRVIENYECIISPKIVIDLNEIKKIIALSPDYIDIDLLSFESNLFELINYSVIYNVKSIVSFHLPKEIFNIKYIESLIRKMLSFCPDYIKLVFNPENLLETNQLLNFYDIFPNHKLLLFGMGQELKYTRLEAIKKGSPFMYVSHPAFGETAPGQFSLDEIKKV